MDPYPGDRAATGIADPSGDRLPGGERRVVADLPSGLDEDPALIPVREELRMRDDDAVVAGGQPAERVGAVGVGEAGRQTLRDLRQRTPEAAQRFEGLPLEALRVFIERG